MKKKYRILICLGACATALLLPAIGLEALLPPIIALAGFMAAEWGFSYMMPVTVSGCLGFCFLQPWLARGSLFMSTPAEYCLVITFVLATVAAGLAMRSRLKNRWAILIYTVIFCIGIYLSFTAESILAGKAPYAGVVSSLQDMDAQLEAVLGDTYTAQTSANVAAFISAMPNLLMMFSLLTAELTALSVFFMGRIFYRAFHKEPAPMADFTLWRLPSSSLWGLLLTAGVCALAFLLKLNIAAALAWTMGLAFTSMFALQGVCFLSFLYSRTHAPRIMRVLTIIFTALFMPYSALFLALIGIYEQIGKKRLLIAAYERQIKLERSLKSKRDELEKYGYTREDLDLDKSNGNNDDSPDDPADSGDDEGKNNDL